MTNFLSISLLMRWGKSFDTDVLINMHWVIISHSEKSSDIKDLGHYLMIGSIFKY